MAEVPSVERMVHNSTVLLRLPVPPAYDNPHKVASGYLAREIRPGWRFEKRIARAEQSLVDEWLTLHRAAGAFDEHEFAGQSADCETCGEGRQHYLHTDRDASDDEPDS